MKMIQIQKDEQVVITPGIYYENGSEYLFQIQKDCVGILILWTEESPVDKKTAERDILEEYSKPE